MAPITSQSHSARDGVNQPGGFGALVQKLTDSRREIIRPVLEHPRDYVLLSIRDLASKLQTDPATMSRIVRGMGFTTYRDFQWYLHELSIKLATMLDLMQDTGAGKEDIPAHIDDSLHRDFENLQALRHTLEAHRISQLARRVCSARRIIILGGDLATSLSYFLEYNLTILGLTSASGTSPGRVIHLVRTVGRKDLVIAMTFRRGLRQTVEGLKQARARGAYCVGLTDTYLSPVVRYSHEAFLASIESPCFAGSYVAPMAFLNVLLVACANLRRRQTLALLKQADEEQRDGFRWYHET
ncbi:MAG: MurR/RpiR family transcriptional regulator [Terriglobia bacterium]